MVSIVVYRVRRWAAIAAETCVASASACVWCACVCVCVAARSSKRLNQCRRSSSSSSSRRSE